MFLKICIDFSLRYNKINHITFMKKRIGVDLKYHESSLPPKNGEGKRGLNCA